MVGVVVGVGVGVEVRVRVGNIPLIGKCAYINWYLSVRLERFIMESIIESVSFILDILEK